VADKKKQKASKKQVISKEKGQGKEREECMSSSLPRAAQNVRSYEIKKKYDS